MQVHADRMAGLGGWPHVSLQSYPWGREVSALCPVHFSSCISLPGGNRDDQPIGCKTDPTLKGTWNILENATSASTQPLASCRIISDPTFFES
jgi:hypothetical protein